MSTIPNSQPPAAPLLASGSPPPPYFVQNAYSNPNHFPHHASVSALWETKWRGPCSKAIYPFEDGKLEDFEPIFAELIKRSGDDVKILYDPDAYAAPFLPVGDRLLEEGKQAEKAGDASKAKELFFRAGAVYRISRFPINRAGRSSQRAWESNKEAYMRGSKYLDPPNREAKIPFTHAAPNDKGTEILAYLRIPTKERPANGWPVLLFICGIDAYRTDHTSRIDDHTAAGFAVLSLEIPGTGDCPAAFDDPASPDRVWSSVLDWIGTTGKQQYGFDPSCVAARGISTGGYYAFRIAHTHAERLLAVVAQGGLAHHAFNPDWVRAMDHMEYPFALSEAFAYKFGYPSVDEMCSATPSAKEKFSLVESGLLDRPSCRLLVINGMLDSIFPIEDGILVATRGQAKDVRFFEARYHTGDPGASEFLMEWVDQVMRERKAVALS